MKCLALLLFSLCLLAWGNADAAFLTPAPVTQATPKKPAPGVFLVASRSVHNPFFRATVVYLLEHTAHGSLGVIVNRPLPAATLGDWMPEIQGTALASTALFDGGPIYADYLTVLIDHWQPGENVDPEQLIHVSGDVYASYDPAVLLALPEESTGEKPRVRCYFGHLGWYAGQLEQEIAHQYWHLLPGDVNAVFGPDISLLWQRLIDQVEPVDLLLNPGVSQLSR